MSVSARLLTLATMRASSSSLSTSSALLMMELVMVAGIRHKRNGRRAGSNYFDRLESAYRQDLLVTLDRR